MQRRDFLKAAGVAGAAMFLEGDGRPRAERGAETKNTKEFMQKASVDLAGFEDAIDGLPTKFKDVNETLDKIAIPKKIESVEDLKYYTDLVTKLIEAKQSEDDVLRNYEIGFLRMTNDILTAYSNFIKSNLDKRGVSDAEVTSLTRWQSEDYEPQRKRIEDKIKTAREQKTQLDGRFESIISAVGEAIRKTNEEQNNRGKKVV